MKQGQKATEGNTHKTRERSPLPTGMPFKDHLLTKLNAVPAYYKAEIFLIPFIMTEQVLANTESSQFEINTYVILNI